MKRLLLAVAITAAPIAHGGCIDNSNQVGRLDMGGSGGSVVVVGGRGGGMESGGSGNGPGAMGGRVGSAPLIAQCTLTGARLTLSRECSTVDDCVAVAETKTVRLSAEPAPGCDVLYFGIAVAEAAALEAFELDCKAVAACAPNETRVVTEDGQSAPLLGSTPLATCRNSVCRSYLP